MKLKFCFFILLLMGCIHAIAQQSTADFWSVNSQNDTLYYNILSTTEHTAELTNARGGIPFNSWNYTTTTADSSKLYRNHIVIPDSVVHNDTTYRITTIGRYAFDRCTQLSEVTLASTLTTIEKYAFRHCDSLKAFTIPNAITTIKDSAFCDNPNLKTLYWNAQNISSYGEYVSWQNSFYRPLINTPIQIVVFGEGVREIPDFAFSDISTLDSLKMSNSISKIGAYAFFDCHLIEHIELPNALVEIYSYAFRQCRGLSRIDIPNSVVALHENIFADCSGLTHGTLPNAITEIPRGLFYRCSALSQIEIPQSVKIIKSSAFNNCTVLDSVVIPNSVKEIQIDAFVGCRSLKEITLPPSINDLGNAFDYTPQLHTVYWNAPHFTDSTFGSFDPWQGGVVYPFNNSAVKKVVFGDTVEMIPHYAFQNSAQLDSIIIGKRITEIQPNAFAGCSHLSYLRIEATTPPTLAASAFNYVDSSVAIYVPCNGLAQYLAHPDWRRFRNIQSYNTCHQITATSNNEAWGTVEGSNLYPSNSIATLRATAMENYQFVDWNDGNTENPRAVVVTQDSTFIAHFTLSKYHLNATSNNDNWGTVEGSSIYPYGDTATLKAIPTEGYHFVSWNDGNTENPREVVMTQDSTFTATFEINQYQISVVSNNAQWGTATGGNTYPHGEIITLEAIAAEGYHFASWSDGNSENPRTVLVTCDSIFIANFAISQYQITVNSNNEAWGITTGSNTYLRDSIATLKATAMTHYHFERWNDYNIENPRNIVVKQDSNFTALFAIDQHQLVLASNNTMWGTATGGGLYDYGERITIEAIAQTGYRFVAWNNGDSLNPREITLTSDSVLVANFEKEHTEGIEDRTDIENLTIYPNPTTGYLHIGAENIQNIEVYNALGLQVTQFKNSGAIDLSLLKAGIYTLKIETKKGIVLRKIIKK